MGNGMVILAALLPVPPSANSANKRNRYGGVFKDQSVVQFRADVHNVLNNYERAMDKRLFGIHRLDYINWAAIKNNEQAYKLRTKTALSMRRRWRIIVHVFVNEDRRDADNCIKEFQDAICKAIGVNDKCISDVSLALIVNKDCEPHAEVVIREATDVWQPGSLLEYVKLELHLGECYEGDRSLDRAG
jgi:Holliday junction resolvase RusA-like endonuclease